MFETITKATKKGAEAPPHGRKLRPSGRHVDQGPGLLFGTHLGSCLNSFSCPPRFNGMADGDEPVLYYTVPALICRANGLPLASRYQ